MMNEYIEKDFVLYTVQHFGSMLTWSKEDTLAEIERVVKREKPIGDVVCVVRCKDCKHFIKEEHGCDHHGYYYHVHVKDDDFCSYGERREGE